MTPEPSDRSDYGQRLREERRAPVWDQAHLVSKLRGAEGRDVSAATFTAQVRATNAHIIALDTELGARDMLDAVIQATAHARRIAYTRFPSNRDLLSAVAEAHQIAGWIAFDAERQDVSRQMTLEALLTARQAGDRSMEAFALGQLAMQDVHVGQAAEAASISDTALTTGRVKGGVRTMFVMRAARAAAGMREHARARNLIGQARSRYLDGPHPDDPAWVWWLSEGEISWHHAMIEADVGRWEKACEYFAAAADFRLSRYNRSTAVCAASLLWALSQAGDWSEAETVLRRDVLPHQGEAVSIRADRMLASAARLLDAAPRPSLRDAAREIAAQAWHLGRVDSGRHPGASQQVLSVRCDGDQPRRGTSRLTSRTQIGRTGLL